MTEQNTTTTADPLIAETEEHGREAGAARMMQAANLFDLRRIIGGLFVLYGVLLTIMGLLDSAASVQHSAGVRINLWAGLGMFVLGVLFLLWAFRRPLADQLDDGSGSVEFGGGPRGDGNGAVGNGNARA